MSSKLPSTVPAGPESPSLTWAHYGVLLTGQLAVGSAAILARLGLGDGLQPVSLSAWRLAIAGLLLVVLGAARSLGKGRADRPTRADGFRLVAAGVLLGLHFVTWFASLQRIPVGRSTLLVTTSPVFTGLIAAVFLRHRIPARFWWGLLVAGSGLVVVTSSSGADVRFGAGPPWIGDLLALAGAATIAVYLLIAQEVQPRIGSAGLITWTYSSAALVLWPAALFTESASILPRGPAGWGSILGMALIPQLIGHTSMNWSLKHFSAGAVGASTLLEPVFAALLAWWLFGERISAIQAAGAVILLIGVGLAITARNESSRPPES